MKCSAVFLPSILFVAVGALACASGKLDPSISEGTEPVIGSLDAGPTQPLSPYPMETPLVAISTSSSSPCGPGMVHVSGDYCPEVEQHCLRWLDPPGPYQHFRCAEYAPSTCLSTKRVHMDFCVDREEYTADGDSLPLVHQSWTTAGDVCKAEGKRLCMESEWQFACEGEDMRPYPYGFTRDATACNIDRNNLGKPNAGLNDLRMPAGSHPRCVSPFGVLDMSGNVEEWATLDNPIDPTDKSSMKGAWWLPGRNTCRAATTGHGETYEGGQVGIRCCADRAPGS